LFSLLTQTDPVWAIRKEEAELASSPAPRPKRHKAAKTPSIPLFEARPQPYNSRTAQNIQKKWFTQGETI
jgi:hypothetical protein